MGILGWGAWLLGECGDQVVATRRSLSVGTLLGLQGGRLSVDTLSGLQGVFHSLLSVDYLSTRQYYGRSMN